MIYDRVRQAYEELRLLRIGYKTGDKPKQRSVREIEVYAYDERYIDAYCRLRSAPRSFRLDRIQHAEVLEESFELDSEIEHQIKVVGRSRQAHECQRPCCRPNAFQGPRSPAEDARSGRGSGSMVSDKPARARPISATWATLFALMLLLVISILAGAWLYRDQPWFR